MTDELNDMSPANPGKELPASLDKHLRAIIPEKDLDQFREQLPAEFLSDASEGLDNLKDTEQLESVLQKLNQQMYQHLKHKKMHNKRRSIGDLGWTYWAIIIILLLTIVGFVVIRMLLNR
jgi:hypothetical protein